MERILVIAEAGVNHNGDFGIAKEMIAVAKRAGADVVKFQTANGAGSVISRFAPMAEYQVQNTGKKESQAEMVGRLLLPIDDFAKLKEHCESLGIEFMSTPFDIRSVRYLNGIGQKTIKIPSGEITNLPYLIEIGKLSKPVIMSTGMSTLGEIGAALKVLQEHGATDITLLHCNTQYPTPFEDANLRAMETLKREFGLPVGYSDHTPGIEAAVAAVALGATVIEKHFTLDKNMEGPDHKASLEPGELAAMAGAIRNIEKAMGDGLKRATPSEQGNVDIARKSVIAACYIRKGEIFTEDNITTKRPGNGVSPMRWFEVLGAKAKRDFEEDELIEV